MLSRFSVKKPYTVVVAVVLIIILGIVSFTKMNTDLFPSMNLPYAIVMTTYPGASPESVEEIVTKPIEQSMATVSNIKNVTSSSGGNMSMVMLEFAQTANMDSITIEMREKLDQIGAYWDDTVGKPVIMKLNPDMMPVVVAAVDVNGLTGTEITDYVEKEVKADVESIDGVASVTTSGDVIQNIDVLIRQEKIDEMNEKVAQAVENSFAEKEQDLKEAQDEIDSGKEKMESGKDQLENGKQELASKTAEGEASLNQAQNEVTKGETEIDIQLQQLASKQAEIDMGMKVLEQAEAKAKEGLESLSGAKGALEALIKGIEGYGQGLDGLQAQIDALDPKGDNFETEKKALEEQLKAISVSQEELQKQLDGVLKGLQAASSQEALESLAAQSDVLQKGLDTVLASKAELQKAQEQLTAGKQQLEQAKEQIASGKVQVSQAMAQLSTQKVLASIDMSVAAAKIDSGTVQLEQAQKQLDSGKDQMDDAKEQVQEKMDLNTILTSEMVKGILTAENFSMPAGYLTEEGIDYLVRVGDKVQDVESLQDLVILDLGMDGLAPIHLSDVADVAVTDNSSEVYAKLNGNPGVLLSIEKQTGYSTGDVSERILDKFDSLQKEDPDLNVTILMNQGIYIDMVVNSVLQNLLSGAVLAILILFLFLKDIRPTAVVACSIPISVVTAIVLMYFSGVTLNVISLSGLALGVGMLVDNSIVVIENIYRLRNEGVPVRKAAIEGSKQVAGAIASSTLTTICVFAPIVFTEGITKQLFVDMGLTIAFSLVASLVVALTLVPMMAAGLLKNTISKPTKFLDRVRDAYGRAIGTALRFKAIVLIAAVLLFAGSMALAISKGTAFMPEMESTQSTVTITTDKEATFEETTKMADEVISKIEDIEDIETIGAMAGGSGMSMMGGGDSDHNVSMFLVLKENKKLSGDELTEEIKNRTKDMNCEIEVQASSMDMSALGGSGINIKVKGKDLDTLQSVAGDISEIVENTKGTKNVSDGVEETDSEYRVIVDKSKAMRSKLTVAQVFEAVNKRLAEAKTATTVSTSTKDYKVYVKNESDETMTKEELENLTITVTNNDNEQEEIRIGDIADFEEAVSPQSISRENQSRYLAVTAEIDAGHNIGLVSQELQKKLDQYELPEGYTIDLAGEDETINEAMGQLMLMLLLALVFMYLIMVAQFQSLLSPFIIMFTIPLAFTGGFMGLLAANKEVSVIALVGFVMLSGIIVNNGIVLVDYINQLRKEGMEKRQAIIEAGRARLRPIIMTALTTVLGLTTMAMGLGMGGDMVQPMAIVTIGGLLYGTLLTLFVVPCIYDILNRKQYKKDEERLLDEEDHNTVS